MTAQHLVKINWSLQPGITQDWLNQRYQFFVAHTLRSLLAQTYQNFRIWHYCANLTPSHTTLLQELLPPDVAARSIFTYGTRPYLNQDQGDYVYVTRIDSDDLYSPHALAYISNCRPISPDRPEIAMFRRGYSYDLPTRALTVYDNPSSPFHSLLIPTVLFNNAYPTNYGDHSTVTRDFPTQYLPDWQFTVLTHAHNYSSAPSYKRALSFPIERRWNIDRFLAQPVVFDVDDFCDQHNCLPQLDAIADRYPNFRCTVFTIPARTSPSLLASAASRPYLELAPHGINHRRTNEMVRTTYNTFYRYYRSLPWDTIYVRGFRPPGWYLPHHIIRACNVLGLWIALHPRDTNLTPAIQRGHYMCGARLPHAHYHANDVCGNHLSTHLPSILRLWPRDQPFLKVSEALLDHQ